MKKWQAGLLAPVQQVWDYLPRPWRRRVLHLTNPRFLVGVVALIPDQNNRILFLEHRFRTPHRWGLPGGFIQHGEPLDIALRRELFEELGLTIPILPEPFDTELNVEGAYVSITLRAAPVNSEKFVIPVATEITGGRFVGPLDPAPAAYPHHLAVARRYWATSGALPTGPDRA